MWWNIVLHDWNLDEKSHSKWQYSQHCRFIMPTFLLQGMTNNVRLTFSVGCLHCALQLVFSKTIRIVDTKYHV